MNSQQLQTYLQAMDIPLWLPRTGAATAEAPAAKAAPAVVVTPARITPPPTATEARQRSLDAFAELRAAHNKPKTSPVAEVPAEADRGTASELPAVAEHVAGLDWDSLQAEVEVCQRCSLHEARKQGVLGSGSRQARLLVVGAAPGDAEDEQGEPFVGAAGMLLNEMLLAMGFRREEVYITNILKSRTSGDRDPLPEEVSACRPFLDRQIELISPRAILAIGKVAARNLLQQDGTLDELRGQRHYYHFNQIPIVATCDPAYLLHTPRAKAEAWDDLKLLIPLLQ